MYGSIGTATRCGVGVVPGRPDGFYLVVRVRCEIVYFGSSWHVSWRDAGLVGKPWARAGPREPASVELTLCGGDVARDRARWIGCGGVTWRAIGRPIGVFGVGVVRADLETRGSEWRAGVSGV